MNADSITKENIVFFFNKYKYNKELIYHLERRILKESYDYKKWESQRLANSDLTRRIFKENTKLLEEFIEPAIKNPEKLSHDAINTFLLHITFFLFENHIDTHIVDDLIKAILKCNFAKNEHIRFNCKMNLGISKTLALSDSFEEIIKIFEEAENIFTSCEQCGDDTTRIHYVFCCTYEMLSFALYKSSCYNKFVEVYERVKNFLYQGNDILYSKMWGDEADYQFHIEYLLRFFRIYGIFTAGQNDFSFGKDSLEDNEEGLKIIEGWLKEEYQAEKREGKINLMIYTYYQMLRKKENEITKNELYAIFREKFYEIENLTENEKVPIFPEHAFPDDNDPVDPLFSNMLDKMKLFNHTFSYTFVFLYNFIKICEDSKQIKKIIQQIICSFEEVKYADKGFKTDKFVIDLVKLVTSKLENEKEFMLFIQSIFIHRQISSSIHLGMVSSLAGICLYHVIQEKPELSIIPGVFSTRQEVIDNRIELLKLIKNAALLHDIGKLDITDIVNLQFRPITYQEFEKIKKHPTGGREIIQGTDYLEQYQDFIEGHHKYWNDEGGYPESFKLYSSPYKVLINLVAICDMIDTTTDTMGRNYSVQKNFDEVINEIKKGSGTRYCPELVDVIVNSPNLIKELKNILTIGRSLNSFKTYQNFILPNMSFSEKDEKSISLYEDKFYTNLKEFYKYNCSCLTEKTIENHISEILSMAKLKFYILHDKNDLIYGVAIGHTVTPLIEGGQYFSLDEIIIREGFRRMGYGTELLNSLILKEKEEGITRIKVSVENDFSSETFFWIAGFSQSKKYLLEKSI